MGVPGRTGSQSSPMQLWASTNPRFENRRRPSASKVGANEKSRSSVVSGARVETTRSPSPKRWQRRRTEPDVRRTAREAPPSKTSPGFVAWTPSTSLMISSSLTRLKSWVAHPCGTITDSSNSAANRTGMLPPPISPIGPGWTFGMVKTRSGRPSRRKKKLVSGTVTDSPISRKNSSIAREPSVRCAMNAFRNESPWIPKAR